MRRAELDPLLGALEGFGEEPGVWAPESAEAPVALGCRPFRITAEDACYRPPLRSADGRIVLVADVRLDNRDELARSLGLAAGERAGLPDAAFVLAAYEAWGGEAPRRLLGDFAFVLWDGQRRALVAARDGVGQRPLCYHRTPRRLAFASTALALLALPDTPRRLDEQKIADTLVLLQDPGRTFVEGVHRLLPGHTLTATADGVRIERFWSPVPARPLVLRSDREYVEGFLEVFDQAVQVRLRSAGDVGVVLSGGLDSTAVAGTAALQLRAAGRRVFAYHAAPRLGFRGEARPGVIADESGDVAAVAALHENLDLTVFRPDGRTPLDSMEAMFRWYGLPPRNPSNQWWGEAIYAAAREAGVRVLLTGDKGNATISYTGLPSLADLAAAGHWWYLWRELRALAAAKRQRLWPLAKHRVLWPLLPAPLARGYRRLRGSRETPAAERACSAIRPEFARSSGVEERLRAAGKDEFALSRLRGVPHRVLALTAPGDAADLDYGFRGWFGIETRDPTADRRVIEYCFAIPGSQYLRGGTDRWLVRRAMRGRVPDRVLDRRTRGLQSADWTEWFPALRTRMRACLDRMERSETARRALDLERLRLLVDRWPDPLGAEHEADYLHRLLRGITVGSFICWFEDTYT
ncbi:MAG TPA: asparagine synthase-related protein [Gemmatimonadales bacterium]|nr:asparagine synthase-related protein [Gemmatimonadales bacterium]